MAKLRRANPDAVVFDAVESGVFDVAVKRGIKETVHLFEAALIARAIHEGEGNYSEAARILQTPVTTLGSRKDVLAPHIKKMVKKLRR